MKTSDIVLSAATVASAISALGHLGAQGVEVEITTSSGKFSDQANAAVSASQAQREIRAHIPNIARTVKLDKELLSEKYMQVADYRLDVNPLEADNTIDTRNGGNHNVIGCYTNCHSACHGSRGWR